MGRILAIDYGLKRVGIAVTDPSQIIATPLDTVATPDVLLFIEKYMQREPVDLFVVGMPVHLDSSPTDATPHVKGFVKRLKQKFPEKEVVLADERFTSRIAKQTMLAGGVKKMDRRDKGMVDRLSATILLQSYMESRGFGLF
ncbi:MAG: Holliday junction resolvase RuvX [Sphingobacteriales bacterium]|nr:MAG: Holliday junction resolvase RuvX [Sphingobacteriales bacterium]